jgi:hypothetical protein
MGRDPREIRDELETTRAELGGTVNAPARAAEKAESPGAFAGENAQGTTPPVLGRQRPLWIVLATLTLVFLARVLLSQHPGEDDGMADAVP